MLVDAFTVLKEMRGSAGYFNPNRRENNKSINTYVLSASSYV